MADRFFVDERNGCVAVRDRFRTDDRDQGLDFDTRGVVKFWMGRQVKADSIGWGQTFSWMVPPEFVAEARELCDKMNADETCAAAMIANGVHWLKEQMSDANNDPPSGL